MCYYTTENAESFGNAYVYVGQITNAFYSAADVISNVSLKS